MSRTASWPVVGVLTLALTFLIDQVSKVVLIGVMRPPGVSETPFDSDRIIELLPVFNLRMAWNTGISFSLFRSGTQTGTYLLLAMTLAISVGVVWYMWRAKGPLLQIALGLIAGGGLGNSFDRAIYGAVADFFDFHWGTAHFPTFNVADICIDIGIALCVLDAILSASHHAPPHQKDRP